MGFPAPLFFYKFLKIFKIKVLTNVKIYVILYMRKQKNATKTKKGVLKMLGVFACYIMLQMILLEK